MSSYNDFLSQIEVDEKELKRDLQSRKNENNKSNKGGVKPQGSSNNPNGTKSLKKLPSNKQPIKKTNNIEVLRNSNQKKDITIQQSRAVTPKKKSEVINKEVNKPQKQYKRDERKQSDLVKDNRKTLNSGNNIKPKVEKSSNRSDTQSGKNQTTSKNPVANRRSNPNFKREGFSKQKVHLRQKKVVDQFSRDKALVEKQTFSISKDDYDKKVMGTIRQQSTKMIFLRDGEKLAKVPKSVAFLGLYAFFLSVIMLLSFSRVGTLKMELKNYNAEFNELNEVNAQLNIKLATAYNIDNIRQRAENELYMSKPESHQIMYIKVVPENYVEYGTGTDNE